MANASPNLPNLVPKTVYKFTVKAIKVPPGQRICRKEFGHFDDAVTPRSYWFLTADLVALALALGLLLGRFLLG
jgi:hypothetical protein